MYTVAPEAGARWHQALVRAVPEARALVTRVVPHLQEMRDGTTQLYAVVHVADAVMGMAPVERLAFLERIANAVQRVVLDDDQRPAPGWPLVQFREPSLAARPDRGAA